MAIWLNNSKENRPQTFTIAGSARRRKRLGLAQISGDSAQLKVGLQFPEMSRQRAAEPLRPLANRREESVELQVSDLNRPRSALFPRWAGDLNATRDRALERQGGNNSIWLERWRPSLDTLGDLDFRGACAIREAAGLARVRERTSQSRSSGPAFPTSGSGWPMTHAARPRTGSPPFRLEGVGFQP